MILTVNITALHISRAVHSRSIDDLASTTCPVARALLNSKPFIRAVSIGENTFGITVNNYGRIFGKLPLKVKYFIVNFDLGIEVYPMTFEVEIPELDKIKEINDKIREDIRTHGNKP